MKTGKITAKLRDAVPVCLMAEGREVKRYKNMELPDMLKEAEMPAISKPAEPEETAAEPETTEDTTEPAAEAAEPAEDAETDKESSTMEISCNVTGPRRKELATAADTFIGTAPVYQKAPTYAFAIGSCTIDRNGTLSGEKNEALTEALAEQGFTAA